MENTIQLKCRKCGEKHLTIKCDKNNKDNNKDNKDNNKDNKDYNKDNKDYNKNYNKDNKDYNKNYNKDYNKDYYKDDVKYKVQITNLPNNIEFNEVKDLMKDWGTILKINIKNYNNFSFAIIEFKNKNEQEYFIKALDKTPFEYMILNISLV